jgi:hypothetical protein
MDAHCPICLLDVRIPVEFICFPCGQNPNNKGNHIHCHSIARVCMTCARRYLELNKNRNERSITKKCLFCNAKVNPQLLNASKAYKKDYRMMAMDSRSDYSCVHCDTFIGTQNELDRHLQLQCDYRTKFCTACKGMYIAKDEEIHFSSCPFMMSCPCSSCDWRDDVKKFDGHLLNIHDSKYCYNCDTVVLDRAWTRHMEATCPNRMIYCKHCSISTTLDAYKVHLRDHILDWTQKIQGAMEDLTTLDVHVESID